MVVDLVAVICILEACNKMKVKQDREVFISDRSAAVKGRQGQLCTMYTYPITAHFGG